MTASLQIVPRSKNQRPASVGREHRLFGVDDQIEEDLLNLVRVREDCGVPGERLHDHHVTALFVRAQRGVSETT
jgi:hypothetical protein